MGQTLSKVKSNPYNSSSTTTISVTPHRTEPTGTTASQHQVNEYTATNGSDTVCIVLVASLEFHIKYNAINVSGSVSFVVSPVTRVLNFRGAVVCKRGVVRVKT